jgi:hypothetical protein
VVLSSWLTVSSLVLCGCFTADVDLTVSAQNTVSGQAVVAVDRAVVARSGPVDDVVAGLVEDVLPGEPPSGTVTTEPYADDERVGVRVVLDEVGLVAFGPGATGSTTVLQITREADRYQVAGEVDLRPAALGVADDPAGQRLLRDASVSLRLTFPGLVTASNGTVEGRSVRWDLPLGEVSMPRASAEATPTGSFGARVVVGLAMVAGAVMVVLLVSARRRSRRAEGRHAAAAADR